MTTDAKPAGSEPRPGSREAPYSVGRVVRGANSVLERTVGTIWIEGEVSSLSRPSSGHLYFALVDDRSSLRAVMWKADVRRLKFDIDNGQSLSCRGRLGIYERDGKFQFYVQVAEPAGLGADALALLQLREKLAGEGLFNADRKRALPQLPRRIGVVTSKSGAALRDIVRAVERRFPTPIVVADARVQGSLAPRQLVHAIREIGAADVDVVIIGRGGGSAGDLSAFNDERVVRAVAACPVPTISAVGHEVDLSLTDLVADQRAATPTMAGEMAVPVREDLRALLAKEQRRLAREVGLLVRSARQEIDGLCASGRHALDSRIGRERRALSASLRRLEARHPQAQLERSRAELSSLGARMSAAASESLARRRAQFSVAAGQLAAMSPLQVLSRGYAIASREGAVLRRAEEVSPGQDLTIRLASGHLECRALSVHPDSGDGEED